MDHKKNNETPDIGSAVHGKEHLTIKHKASNAWRFIWAGVGVIGTLSGVLGVYEFLAGSNGPQNQQMTSQEMIVAMVNNNSITVEEAARLAKALVSDDGDASSQATESIQKIAVEGTDRQREALSLLSQEHTRPQGLELLRSEATTAEDWLTLARFAQDSDEELALSSIKKSLALAPENFEALTMFARLQAKNDDFAAAMRSAATAEVLANSPYESLLASRTKLDISRQAQDVSAMQKNIDATVQKLNAYEEANASTSLPDSFALDGYRQHPVWVRAVTHQVLAVMYNFIDQDAVRRANLHNTAKESVETLIANNARYSKEAIEQASTAISLYDSIQPLVNSEDSYTVAYNNIISHNHLAFAHLTDGNGDTGVKFSSEMLELVRMEAETGNRKAIEDLPTFYNRHAAFLVRQNDIEGSLKTRRRSTHLQISYLKKHGSENLALKTAKLELDYAIIAARLDKYELLEQKIDAYLGELEAVIKSDLEEDNHMVDYAIEALNISGAYERKPSELENGVAAMNRGAAFIDELIAQHGENHGRLHAKHYMGLYRGDILFFWGEKQLALLEYQKVLAEAENIIPTEKEPDVVVFSQLETLYRIGNLNIEGSEDALIEGIKLGKELDKGRRLTTTYQTALNEMLRIANERGIAIQ
ncbi:hypothetical protein EYS14_00305 [Alteromonadaceae bacterium M269]|nr:hypothetical protein EYS14_00305 [Alteromonadaceae bacterium M269]